MGDSAPSLEEEIKPIELDISDDAVQKGAQGLLHNAAEFLIISITGCAPKR